MRRLLQVTANEDNKNVDFQVLSGIVSDYHAQVCNDACVRCVCGGVRCVCAVVCGVCVCGVKMLSLGCLFCGDAATATPEGATARRANHARGAQGGQLPPSAFGGREGVPHSRVGRVLRVLCTSAPRAHPFFPRAANTYLHRRHDTTRHDTTRHDTTRHDTTRHDTTHRNKSNIISRRSCSGCGREGRATPSCPNTTPTETPTIETTHLSLCVSVCVVVCPCVYYTQPLHIQ
jgi:hypothetical protein